MKAILERFGDRFGEYLSERFGGSWDCMSNISLVTGSVKGPKRGEIGKYGNMLKNEPRMFRIRSKYATRMLQTVAASES